MKIDHLPKSIDEEHVRHHFHETHWKKVALGLLADHVGGTAGLSLLDYGCGRGETLALAKEMGMTALGTDVDPDCVALAGTQGQTELLRKPDAPVEQFGGKSFDVITCFHVLEHVARPKEVLESLGRIARSYVVVAVPNLRCLPRPRDIRREPPHVNEGHLQGWDHSHFRNLAETHCGLRLIAWGHDHVKIPVIGNLVSKCLGERVLRDWECGYWARWFPFHSASVIALMKPA